MPELIIRRRFSAAVLAALFGALVFAATPAVALTKQEIKCRDGSGDERLDVCGELIKKGKGDTAAYYNNRAFEWQDRGECDLAISDFGEALSIAEGKSDNTTTYNYTLRLGNAWSDCKGDKKRSIELYTRAMTILPDDASAYENRAIDRHEVGELDGAIEDIQKAMELSPDSASHYNEYALILRDKGDLDGSLSAFNRSIGLDHKSGQFYANRSALWLLRGDLDKALADGNKSVELTPKRPHSVALRGDVFRYLGEYEKAIADYNKSIELLPGYTVGYTGLGLTYEKMGDPDKAREFFEKSVKSGKNSALADVQRVSYQTAEARLAAYSAGSTAAPSDTAPAEPQALVSAPKPVLPTGKRVALVIGNSAYTKVPALPNPPRDAAAVANALRQAGFAAVTVANDTDRQALAGALRNFAVEAESAEWALVYYSGHGIEVGGVNYLIPIDAQLAVDRDVQYEAIPLEQVLASVEGAKKLKIVVLDACRDNPFAAKMRSTVATRSIGRGLSRVEPEGATLVVYSAKHGQTALDGDGKNSPFAQAFLKRLPTPGVEINKLFRLVRDDVMELTSGQQEPFLYGSLPGREDYFFVAAK